MRLVVHLLVIALIGLLATRACLAEDAPGTGAGSAPSANPNGSRPPAPEDAAGGAKLDHQHAPGDKDDSKIATGEGGQRGNAAGRDVNPAPAVGKDSDAIDTRITVQPRRLGKRDELREGDTKPRPFARHSFRRQRLSKREGSGQVSRDAIGLPVIRHDGKEQESGQRHDVPAVVHEPAVAPTGFGANASSGGARTDISVGRPSSNANLIVRPSALNRGTINGTSLARPGLGSSSIGGPAKPIAGINGTTIRSKHQAP
ncbi:MAG: hypothetical protein WAK63_08440 [Xanthobacteraceae bacterium]